MNWFLLALINPVFHAVSNHLDKYLITRWTSEVKVGVLILFSCLFSVLLLPVMVLIDSSLFSAVSLLQGAALVANGSILAAAILLYLKALDQEEASFVVPFFELIPLLGLLLGYVFLGEILTANQMWAGLLIIIGSSMLSFEFNDGKARVKSKVVALMVTSSLLYAINGVAFKYFTPADEFVSAVFWNSLGMVLFGLVILAINSDYRGQFVGLIKRHHYKVLGLNLLNEAIVMAGEIAFMLAILSAPVALVQSIGGLQSLAVFVLGVLITIFFPKFGKESLIFHHLFQKVAAVAVILVGVLMIDI